MLFVQNKIKQLFLNRDDIDEEITTFESQLFENSTDKNKKGLFNAFMLLDALIEQKNFNKSNGTKAQGVFDYKSEQELAQIYSHYLCKSFNNKSIVLDEVNQLVGFFNAKSDHYEILAMEDKPDLNNKLHTSLTSDDPTARIDKYHTLTIKPKSVNLAGAIIVKAVVEAK